MCIKSFVKFIWWSEIWIMKCFWISKTQINEFSILLFMFRFFCEIHGSLSFSCNIPLFQQILKRSLGIPMIRLATQMIIHIWRLTFSQTLYTIRLIVSDVYSIVKSFVLLHYGFINGFVFWWISYWIYDGCFLGSITYCFTILIV